MYLQGVSAEVAARLVDALQTPEGTFMFWGVFPTLLDADDRERLLLEVPAGAHAFRLVRDNEMQLCFVHASPGTGTRIARVDLSQFSSPVDRWCIFLNWSPREMGLDVGSDPAQGELQSAKGEQAPFELQVGKDGDIYEVGSAGVRPAGWRIRVGGVEVLSPAARQLWGETKLAVEALLEGLPEGNFLLEVALSNAALTMLTTGFETYLEHRFLELEREGVAANHLAIAQEFLSRREQEALRDRGLTDLEIEARDDNISLLELLARRINFQNYEKAKRAYNRGFGLRFGEVATSQVLDEVQRLVGYRHRIVHVSPMLALLNQERVPPEEPIGSTRALAARGMLTFDGFISSVHEATLRLQSS